MLSRRDLAKVALAGIPARLAWSEPSSVRIGVATYSFRDLLRVPGRDNVDDVIKALQFAGAKEIDSGI